MSIRLVILATLFLFSLFFFSCSCEEDTNESTDTGRDYGQDIEDTGDIRDTQIGDIEDGGDYGGDTEDDIQDILDDGLSPGDISDISDVSDDAMSDTIEDICIPNCNNKECGDDGCGGRCGICGNNAVCNGFKCECKDGFVNCNGNWIDGCENDIDIKHLWSKSFGGSSYDNSYSVAVDSSNNVYITGHFQSSTINFGGGELTNAHAGWSDIFLAKFDSNGNHLWSRSFGGDSSDEAYSVSVDSSGNIYIAGFFTSSTIDFGGGVLTNTKIGYSDIFIAKFDSNGKHLWSNSFGGNGTDIVRSIFVDKSDNLYITGYFEGSSIDFGGGTLTNAGGADIFLAKFDSDGKHIWSKKFGGGQWEEAYSVSTDSSDNIVIAGVFTSNPISFGGNPLTNAGQFDIFVAKFDADGNHLWSKAFGGVGNENVNSVFIDKPDNIYIVGNFNTSIIDFGGGALTSAGGSDIFLVKFDKDGNHLWSKRFGGDIDDNGIFCYGDKEGNIYITGAFTSSLIDFGGGAHKNAANGCNGYGCFDIFIVKFDGNGNYLWSKSFGGKDGDEIAYSISTDSSNNVFVVGSFDSSNTGFGGCPLSNKGKSDVFLIKYAP